MTAARSRRALAAAGEPGAKGQDRGVVCPLFVLRGRIRRSRTMGIGSRRNSTGGDTAEGPLRRFRVRAVRQDGRSRRRRSAPSRRRCAAAASTCAWSCRSTRACRGRSSSRSRESSQCRCGSAPPRPASASAVCRGATCPSTSSSIDRYFDRPHLYGPPPDAYPRQPRAVRLPVPRRARAREGARLDSRRHPRARLADRARARLRRHRRVGAAAPRQRHRLHHPQPRLSGRVRRAARCPSPASDASTTTRASSSTSAPRTSRRRPSTAAPS